MAQEKNRKKGRTLRFSILTAFTALFLISMLTVIVYTYYSNSRTIINISKSIFRNASENIIEKTIKYLSPAAELSITVSKMIEKGVISERNIPAIKKLSIEIVRQHPQFVMFYYADDYGIYGAEARTNSIINRFEIVRKRLRDKKATLLYEFLNTEDKRIGVEKRPSDFDTRTRPWYIGARENRGIFWTDVYIFITYKMQSGITASYPVYNRCGTFLGVMAADLELERISQFLKNIDFSPHGIAFIINEKGQIISHPDINKAVVKQGKKVRPRRIKELQLGFLDKAYARHRTQNESLMITGGTNQQFVASFIDFPKSFNKKWKIVAYAPVDDFIGEIKATNRISLIISVSILLISLLLISLISRSISRPIVALTLETNRIKEFDLEGEVDIRSSLVEIQMMSDAVQRLKTGLSAFKKYVPETLVKQLILSGEEARLGGRRKELTIFFSDIAGFTSVSEKMAPQELMTLLSAYLDELTSIIIEENGTIDKYIGDAIMAFWGAPLENPQHALYACRAALRCKQHLLDINQRFQEQYGVQFRTRIGIHSGECIVGNVGSFERMNYSIIGDSVNLASRLEGVNKNYASSIIVSEATWQQVQDQFVARPLDVTKVKGKQISIKIYELLATREDADPKLEQMVARWSEAFNAYMEQDHTRARQLLETLRSDWPDDPVLEKCVGLYGG